MDVLANQIAKQSAMLKNSASTSKTPPDPDALLGHCTGNAATAAGMTANAQPGGPAQLKVLFKANPSLNGQPTLKPLPQGTTTADGPSNGNTVQTTYANKLTAGENRVSRFPEHRTRNFEAWKAARARRNEALTAAAKSAECRGHLVRTSPIRKQKRQAGRKPEAEQEVKNSPAPGAPISPQGWSTAQKGKSSSMGNQAQPVITKNPFEALEEEKQDEEEDQPLPDTTVEATETATQLLNVDPISGTPATTLNQSPTDMDLTKEKRKRDVHRADSPTSSADPSTSAGATHSADPATTANASSPGHETVRLSPDNQSKGSGNSKARPAPKKR
ncbi:hypothetical protein R1sor_023270 [Riccia sorocarpa]|uniref:Uncharacterized protein n=1 Tax=Riccia sorocarpa TaxID=122646 RepID=A0ABD3GT65_9MARC